MIQNVVIALDIGSETITIVAGQMLGNKNIKILGIQKIAAEGIRNGQIFNEQKANLCIKKLLRNLREKNDIITNEVCVAISNRFICKKTIKQTCTIEENVISQEHLRSMELEALKTEINNDLSVIQVIPREYSVDSQKIIGLPLGISGEKIEGEFDVICTQKNEIKKIRNCIESSGFLLKKMFAKPYVLASLLSDNSGKVDGTAILGIEEETSGLCIYKEGHLQYIAVLPFGRTHVLNDIQKAFSVNRQQVDEILKKICSKNTFSDDEIICLHPGNGWKSKEIPFRSIEHIIDCRLKEILEGINHQLEISDWKGELKNGIIVTGKITPFEKLPQLVEEIIGMEILENKLNVGFEGKSSARMKQPEYTVAAGILCETFEIFKNKNEKNKKAKSVKKILGTLFDNYS